MLYLLHFERPVGDTRRAAQHYLGWSTNRHTLKRRLAYHRSGNGARVTAVAAERGIAMHLVRVWPDGTRVHERHWKVHSHDRAQWCPVCCGRRSVTDEPESTPVTALRRERAG